MRIDMTTREWHELVKPVLPHVCTDKETPSVCVVRIETAEHAVFAIATDRYTLAAERHWLGPSVRLWNPAAPVHILAADIAATLKLFTYSKDADPLLRVIIDSVPVPIEVAGQPASIDQLAITIESQDGTRLVLHDRRDPSADPLGSWRKTLRSAVIRVLPDAAPALSLTASQFARWAAAVRGGERLAMFTGTKEAELILVIVEKHFCGVWKPVAYLDSPAKMLEESPWRDELIEVSDG